MATKVLIADDDLKLLVALRVRLEAEGYEVITTQDAYQAVDFARRHRPDLLLVDINMPAGRGFSVQERLRQIDELVEKPVIYITGESVGVVDADAQAQGAAAILHKPLETATLLETIRRVLGEEVVSTSGRV